MNRRTLLSLLASTALALGAIALPGMAQAAPREVAPCYGVRYTPPPPPAPKKPERPAKPRRR
jgi:hypothetical protein